MNSKISDNIFGFITDMVAVPTKPHTRLWQSLLWKYAKTCSWFKWNEIMSITTWLDRLHLLFDCSRSATVDCDNYQSVIWLLGIQDFGLFAMACKSITKTTMWLAMWNVIDGPIAIACNILFMYMCYNFSAINPICMNNLWWWS